MSKPPKPTSSLAAQVKAARRVSVPILAITTPDPAATMDLIDKATNGDYPKLAWDIVEGVRPRNETGHAERAKIISDIDPTVGNPLEAIRLARKLSEGCILYVHLTNRWIIDPQFVQAVWNLRDEFKRDHRTLILLGPAIDLPAELAGDVVVLDEPLPDADQLAEIVRETHCNAKLKADDETVRRRTNRSAPQGGGGAIPLRESSGRLPPERRGRHRRSIRSSIWIGITRRSNPRRT